MEQTTTQTKFCHACGQSIDPRAEICPKCGVRQPSTFSLGGLFGPTTPAGRNRVAAALFAILLGSFGVHKFYLGRPGQGIIYAIFFWSLIPAIIAFIEGVIYLTMSDADFAAKYG